MRHNKVLSRIVVLALAATMLVNPATSPAFASTPKPGVSCSKIWQTKVVKSVRYTCIRVNKKLVWNKGVAVARSTPAPKPTQPPIALPSANSIPIYTGGPGSASGEIQTPALAFLPSAAPAGTNLKLWIHLPEDPTVSLQSPGVWIKPLNEAWRFVAGASNGTVFLSLAAGQYLLDTVEPNGNMVDFKRRTYDVTIAADGTAKVPGVLANSAGYFGLTIDRVVNTTSSFVPANQCQLLGQDGNQNMNQGFPARPERLATKGTIRALILPVDFADVPGTDRPETAFFEMANLTDQFYRKMSGNLVSFSFQVLPNYVRMPFSSTFHNLGSWNAGDPNAYYKAVIRQADPLVDYSKFDVVYVLSPRNIPASSIAYGPAFPMKVATNDGFVMNGTISGADAYQAFPGAGWKWMAHETGHLFGLHDLYTIDPQQPTYGSWDIMSLNWSTKAIELNSWNRFIMDWLPSTAYRCLSAAQAKDLSEPTSLIPLGSDAAGTKSIFIPLSSTEILVIEHRAKAGLDNIPSQEAGILVYTVNMTIPSIRGGWKVVRPARSVSRTFEDAALQVGEEVSVGSLQITVTGRSGSGMLVDIR